MAIVTEALFSVLWCKWCSADTTHIVLYVGPEIKEIRCTSCQHRLTVPMATLRQNYMHDLPNRARALTAHSLRLLHQHPRRFVTRLPKQAVFKALEFSAELYAVLAERSE